jgi:hypothetical protein
MSARVSRRGVLEGSVAIATALAVAPVSAEVELSEEQKITHGDAKYQMTPNGQQRCEICLQFEPPDRCKIVRTPISANGWCQFFAARENAH